ncbi:MAG: hypothetical protein IPH62_10810 [Ignavibacteriae bacterium]|nr:hypothetical protein [Ignavibacteriota bacterium]
MKIKLMLFFCVITLFNINLPAQIIQIDSSKTLINIGDSTAQVDSSNQIKSTPKSFLKVTDENEYQYLATFIKKKQELDFENYRYAIDYLNFLPLTSQQNFSLAGVPNIPFIFFQENKNISFIHNNYSLSNSWNGSSDLNLIPSENISSIEVIPLARGFLYNNLNSSAIANIITQDSITAKPISRIRYYQAPDYDAAIDAIFSALIFRDLHLSYRLSNSAYSGAFKNSEYGIWKSDLNSIYRITDSIFAKVNYYHLKSNVELNGGIDVETLLANSVSLQDELFNTISPVNFENRYKETTINKVSGDLYGIILPNSISRLNFIFNQTEEKLRQNIDLSTNDSTRISNMNKFSKYYFNFHHKHSIEEFSFKINLDYSNTDYGIEYYNVYTTKNSYSFSAFADYNVIDSFIVPAIYFKTGNFENQLTRGLGFDVKLNINKNIKFMFGTSKLNQPYLISELFSLPKSEQAKNYVTNYFLTSEFTLQNLKTSITYFATNSDHTPVPIFSNSDFNLNSTKIIFPFTEQVKREGINLISNLFFWNIEFFINANYLLSSQSTLIPKPSKFNISSGIYYRDKLYNNNLDLKTGFNFYFNDNIENQFYDFQIMRSSNYYFVNDALTQFKNYSISNTQFRIDFTLAGRIQDRATFYFAYENILSNNYYSIPFYPIPEGGIRIGISWDFIE